MDFRIQNSSLSLFFSSILLIIVVFTAFGIFFLPQFNNIILNLSYIAIYGFSVYFIPPAISSALIEWTITENGIQLKWLKQFLFQRKPDLYIEWASIQEYKFQPDRNFDQLKITLSDGNVLKFWHNTNITDDRFEDFAEFLEKKIRVYNKARKQTKHHIRRTKNIYETTLGLILGIFSALILVTLPILIFFLPNFSSLNLLGFGAGYSGAIYYLSQVFSHRKKTKQNTF